MKPIGWPLWLMKVLTKDVLMKLKNSLFFLLIFFLYLWLLVKINAENFFGNSTIDLLFFRASLAGLSFKFFCSKNYYGYTVVKKFWFLTLLLSLIILTKIIFIHRWWIVYFVLKSTKIKTSFFKRDVNVFVLSKCFRWEHFFVNSRDRKNHNFLRHTS